MLMVAVWLSSVMTCGRLRMSTRPCVFRARTSKLKELLAAEKTKPAEPVGIGPTHARGSRPLGADHARRGERVGAQCGKSGRGVIEG